MPYLTTNIKYQIGTTLDNTYNDGAGALVTTSPMVQAVGNYAQVRGATLAPCVTNKGGQGSYSAEVISKAQAALPVVAGTQNVIIFLSDGDFSARVRQLRQQVILPRRATSASRPSPRRQAATAAGTKVYSVAYGASTTSGSGSCTRATRRNTRLHDHAGDRLGLDQVLHDQHNLQDHRLGQSRDPAAGCLHGDHDHADQAAPDHELAGRPPRDLRCLVASRPQDFDILRDGKHCGGEPSGLE